MAKATTQPLPAEVLEQVNHGIAAINEAATLSLKCKACGYDTAAWDAYISHLKQRLDAVQQQFGKRQHR